MYLVNLTVTQLLFAFCSTNTKSGKSEAGTHGSANLVYLTMSLVKQAWQVANCSPAFLMYDSLAQCITIQVRVKNLLSALLFLEVVDTGLVHYQKAPLCFYKVTWKKRMTYYLFTEFSTMLQ